eukprot:1674439-Alexandrium_andersonii.AAC.1
MLAVSGPRTRARGGLLPARGGHLCGHQCSHTDGRSIQEASRGSNRSLRHRCWVWLRHFGCSPCLGAAPVLEVACCLRGAEHPAGISAANSSTRAGEPSAKLTSVVGALPSPACLRATR